MDIRAIIVMTREDCQAHTCDCEPGQCHFVKPCAACAGTGKREIAYSEAGPVEFVMCEECDGEGEIAIEGDEE